MKRMFRVAILSAAAVAALTAVQTASAFCDNARVIAGCGGTCAYINSPGQSTTGLGGSMKGNFWGLGGGNPTIGIGDDNGVNLATGNPSPPDDWIKSYLGQNYVAGAWSTFGVDGCVDGSTTPSPKRTVVSSARS